MNSEKTYVLHSIDIEVNGKEAKEIIKWDMNKKEWWVPLSYMQMLMASFDGVPLCLDGDSGKAWAQYSWLKHEGGCTKEELSKIEKALNRLHKKYINGKYDN